MRARAHDDGMRVSAWLRIQLARVQKHSHPRRPRNLSPEAAEGLRQLARVGSLLHQLARWENYRRETIEAVRVLATLRETHAELSRVRELILGAPEEA